MNGQKCPNCGAEIDPDQGLCAACLLQGTLQSEASEPAAGAAAEGDPVKQALEVLTSPTPAPAGRRNICRPIGTIAG